MVCFCISSTGQSAHCGAHAGGQQREPLVRGDGEKAAASISLERSPGSVKNTGASPFNALHACPARPARCQYDPYMPQRIRCRQGTLTSCSALTTASESEASRSLQPGTSLMCEMV